MSRKTSRKSRTGKTADDTAINEMDSSTSRAVRAILESNQNSSTNRPHPRHRALTIVGSISGILLLLVSAYSLHNWSETLIYSSTSHQLTQLIEQAKQSNPDVDQLRIRQRQVNAELASQSSRSALQIPRVRTAISAASKVSTRLDRILADMADGKTWEQAQKDTANGMRPASALSSSSHSSNSSHSSHDAHGSSPSGKNTNSSNQSGKTESEKQEEQLRRKENEEAQRRQNKLNDLLKQNSHSPGTTTDNGNAKPW
jgi:hypothetical protein